MKSKKSKQALQQAILPRENASFIGNIEASTTLFKAYKNSHMPGAWLISGPKGIGKATLAYRFARFILYHGTSKPGLFLPDPLDPGLYIPENNACFTKVSVGSHPDLLVLESGAEGSKAANGDILIEEARKISSFLHLTAAETLYRVIIIDSIDNMNTNAANSILKLLEEPPANALFILISHAPGKLLPTIRSRCHHIKMHKPSILEAYKIFNIIAKDVPEELAYKLLELADGSPGMAHELYLNNALEINVYITSILAKLPKLDVASIHEFADSISGKTNEGAWRVFRILLNKIIIDLTKQKALGESTTSTLGKKINKETKLSVAITTEKLVEIWEEINRLLEETDKLHLERKSVLIRIFSLLGGRE